MVGRCKLIWMLLITALVLVGCGQGTPTMPPVGGYGPGVETPTAEGGAPQPTPLPEGKAIVAEGQLVSPYPKLTLAFGGGVSGQVVTITVKAGDVVAAGDLLAGLDDADLQRAVEDAQLALDRAVADRADALEKWEQDVAEAEGQLAAAERALATARLQYSNTEVEQATTSLDRIRKAEQDAEQQYRDFLKWGYPQSIVGDAYNNWQNTIRERELTEMRLADAKDTRAANALQIEARQAEVEQAERKLAALQKGIAPTYDRAVEDAERKLEQAREALEHARLTAPWAAIVLSVDVAPQANVAAGAPVVTLLNIEDGLRFVSENLSEQHIADVYPGQRAIVTLRTFPEQPLEGVVEAVVPQVAQATTDARFTVYVRLAPSDLRLLPGLTGRVEIFTE